MAERRYSSGRALRHPGREKATSSSHTIQISIWNGAKVCYFSSTMTDVESTTPPGTALWAGSPVYAKYREAAVAGFQPVPDLLLKHQSTLGLSPTNLVVLLNVLLHWWYPEQKPFPRSTTIAKRMGVSPRAVQRSLQQLQHLGLLTRAKSVDGPTCLDPEPLVAKLEELAKGDIDYEIRSRGRRQREQSNRKGEPGPNRLPRGRGLETPF